MTATTLALTDFLLARIAEDEEHAGSWYALHVDHDPQAWVLAECEAKRRIVALHGPGGSRVRDRCARCRALDTEAPENLWPCSTVRALALPYAAHPDFREEWDEMSGLGDLWGRASATARQEGGETVTDVIYLALAAYVTDPSAYKNDLAAILGEPPAPEERRP